MCHGVHYCKPRIYTHITPSSNKNAQAHVELLGRDLHFEGTVPSRHSIALDNDQYHAEVFLSVVVQYYTALLGIWDHNISVSIEAPEVRSFSFVATVEAPAAPPLANASGSGRTPQRGA